nr:glycosyltransferase family 2 protein [uncultured Halomonas sp.]
MIDVILTTYEGESYLAEQLDSLLAQRDVSFQVLICDDGSTDRTQKILYSYVESLPGKIKILPIKERLGVKDNFARLMAHSTAFHIAFCDQDDIWHEDKIKITFERMLEEEKRAPGVPILVHSDLRVVDSDGSVIADSFFDYQKLPKKVASLNEALVKNNVTGCTVMLNRAAIDIAMPIPDEAIMHDWWIACKVIQAGGIISFIDRPLIDYRQHGANTIGAHKTTFLSYVRKAFKPKAAYVSYRDVRRQAKAMGVEIGLPKFLWLKARMLFRK